MTEALNQTAFEFIGTNQDDIISDGFENAENQTIEGDEVNPVRANGLEGDDQIDTGEGNDLAAGDMVGDEWTYVDGEWVYDASRVVVSDYGMEFSFDDFIMTGSGNDVLLGNGGNDMLISGDGNDIVNAGRGNDKAFGGDGADVLNLEAGNDYAEAGMGDDIVNGGEGDDVIYGDIKDANLLSTAGNTAVTFGALAGAGGWTMVDSDGETSISQSAATTKGETYTVSFELAANFSGGQSSAKVEVLWNGDVVDVVETNSGAFETFEVDVVASGDEGELSFRAIEPAETAGYNFDGPIVSYETEVEIAGETVTVSAFAPGQANLYQVIDGQLNIFDVEAREYAAIGDTPSYKINAVGFNVEDDLIYGIAKSTGVDSLGNAVSSSDIVMIDANGDTYRIGDGFYKDYVGDFDNSGNLWTFHTSLDCVSVVDVNNRDENGNPSIQFIKLPSAQFNDRTYDLAYNAENNTFMAVVAPSTNGGAGKLISIDMSDVLDGGSPTFTEIAITGTLYEDGMADGMAKGAFGAVFFDGDGNLYYGLNNGDHDLDGSTGSQGSIFRVNVDEAAGVAYAEFMSVAPSTGSNDGAVDPRSADSFIEVDADAAVLLREPALISVEGGNDSLRGGEGNDEIHGNGGDDEILGGAGEDDLQGDEGNDSISGGTGDDTMAGGIGADSLMGEAGNDVMLGEAGNDYMSGGAGDDVLSGGAGVDKIVGGSGTDIIEGGAGNDQIWGGNWSADGEADIFVFTADSGKDYVHDFETAHDVIDLTAYETDMNGLNASATDLGWATVLDLGQLTADTAENKVVLMGVDLDNLGQDSFIF